MVVCESCYAKDERDQRVLIPSGTRPEVISGVLVTKMGI